ISAARAEQRARARQHRNAAPPRVPPRCKIQTCSRHRLHRILPYPPQRVILLAEAPRAAVFVLRCNASLERFCIIAHYLSLPITSTIKFTHSHANVTANRGFVPKALENSGDD